MSVTIEQLQGEIGTLIKKLATAESELDTLRKWNEEKDSQIKAAKDKRDEALSRVKELEGQLPPKDSVVLSKSDHSLLEEKAKTVDTLTSENVSLKAEKDVRKYAGEYNPDALIAHTPQGGKWEPFTTKNAEGKEITTLRLVQNVDGKETKTVVDDFAAYLAKEKFVNAKLQTDTSRTTVDAKGTERAAAPDTSIFAEFLKPKEIKQNAYNPFSVSVVDRDVVSKL
jgi:hypothetical protein